MAAPPMAAALLDRVARRELLVLDGAMGTELKRRGVPTPLPAWSSHALRVDPEAVLAIHRDYVRAGADLLTSNTFRTTRRALSKVGAGDEARSLTALAVKLARQAAAEPAVERPGAPPVHVLGSMAPLEDCYSPELVPDDRTLAREHAEHAGHLAEAGVEVLLVETMNTRREAVAAVRAARATGLPVLASFLANSRGQMFGGEPLAEVIPALLDEGIAVLLLNCTPVATSDELVPVIRKLSGSTPFGVYANIGFPHPDEGWRIVEEIAPATYGEHAAAWIREGARIVGGCCGTTPAHIAAVRAQADAIVRAGIGMQGRGDAAA